MIDFEAKLAHFASDSMRLFVNLSPLGSGVFGRWRIVFYGLQEVLYGFIERRQPNFRLWYFSEHILAVQPLTCYQKMRHFVNLSPLGSLWFYKLSLGYSKYLVVFSSQTCGTFTLRNHRFGGYVADISTLELPNPAFCTEIV